ncbi:angio-associated migratory cell protein [Diorhabda carinulata]|uniref:angio-associated migratory cell protein n=1 Tax=Diorhabda carinulata TaxID=1163345 RepID=UPI0025A2F575|nr:angio-associated migratory cell protein [Diorhabda carinulata]
MDDFDLPEEFQEVEVIYSDGEDDEDSIEHMLDEITIDDEIETEIIDLSASTFKKHSNAVFSSDLSKDDKIAVTGGEDDVGYVWNLETCEVIFECSGHKDSVIEVCFNFDNNFVATADMSGLVQVWSVSEKKLTWCNEGDDIEWLTWHPAANVLFCGCHFGDIYVWQIPRGNCKVLAAKTRFSTTCGQVLPNGKQLLAGYDDGHIRLWDIKQCSVQWSNDQSKTVTNLDINSEGTLVIISPDSRLIKLSDGKTISVLLPDGESEIETAIFNSKLGILATGSISGQLCVWEIGRQTLRHQARIECAVTVMKWGPDGKIFIGATDGAVYMCDVKTGTLLETLTGHKSDILSISVFKLTNKILTTSEDGTAKIFAFKV